MRVVVHPDNIRYNSDGCKILAQGMIIDLAQRKMCSKTWLRLINDTLPSMLSRDKENLRPAIKEILPGMTDFTDTIQKSEFFWG